MENNSDFIQILLEKIEKDDLPTNVFDVEGTDPLVLLGKMNEIIGQLSNFQSSVNSSNTTANDALSKANESITASSQALSNANNALTTANQAITTANQTIDTANQALESAQTAETNSNLANQKSDNAVAVANDALEQVTQGLGTKVKNNSGNILSETTFVGDNGVNVDMQEQNPNNFVISLEQTITNQIEQNKNNITQLNNDVSELNQTANTAQSTADTANTNAQNAQSTANTALTTANGAVSKNTEQDNSISALQTADKQNVKLTGDQTISGLKTFKNSIILETTTGTFLQRINIDSSGKLTFDEIPYIVNQPIVSSGSNANGYWVRFADGTLICQGRFTASGAHVATLPFAFIDANYIVILGSESSSSATSTIRTFGCTARTTSTFTKGTTSGSIDFNYIAIGRWK